MAELNTKLYAHGLAAYDRAVSTLRSIGQDPELCLDAIERYARAVDMTERMIEGWELDGRPQHAVDTHGVLTAHPLARAIRDCEKHAAIMARDLGLTPDARGAYKHNAGRPPGATSAKDRKPTSIRRAA